MKILITGSAGYIGSCAYEYFKEKFDVFGVDKKYPPIRKQKKFIKCNLLNYKEIKKIIKKINPDIVIHLAGQSTIDFIKRENLYKNNNLVATSNLIKLVKKNKIKYFLFSSTGAVYKASANKLHENYKLIPKNIYGKTKLTNEKQIKKNFKNSTTKFIIFRFFNVCSSLAKNKIGEYHNPETHLIPLIIQKAYERKKIFIYGKNYNTKDGTCVRDYIHIKDIISAFEKGINYLTKKNTSKVINLGSNKGFSNLEVVQFSKKNLLKENVKLEFEYSKKRLGDNAKLICSNFLAKKLLGWYPKHSTLKKIINDEIIWYLYLRSKKIFKKGIY